MRQTSTRAPQLVDVLDTWDEDELAEAMGLLDDEDISYHVQRTMTGGMMRYQVWVNIEDYERVDEVLVELGEADDDEDEG